MGIFSRSKAIPRPAGRDGTEKPAMSETLPAPVSIVSEAAVTASADNKFASFVSRNPELASRAFVLTGEGKRYEYTSFLADTERKFHNVLTQSLPDGMTLIIRPRLADFIRLSDNDDDAAILRREITYLRTSFAVADADYRVLACMELYDAPLQEPEDIKRDMFVRELLEQAGIRFFALRDVKDCMIGEYSDFIDSFEQEVPESEEPQY